MKRLLVLATVVVLLAVLVSSVSAKASPILFLSGTASGAEHIIHDPPTYPDSASGGEDRPTDQYSLNVGGSTITIIVTT